MRYLSLYLTGLIFGTGISISGMANPAKVLNFFDVAGTWDPSLAFVMGGAVIVTFLGYRFVLKRPMPLMADRFHLPTSRVIDARLLGGSAVFGIGWGIAGFAPAVLCRRWALEHPPFSSSSAHCWLVFCWHAPSLPSAPLAL